MRRGTLCAQMICLCLLLCACGASGRNAEELALETRTRMIGLTSCTLTADLSADYGARTYAFTVSASYQKDGESILTVTSPESLSGLSVTYSGGEGSLSFDGARIETGSLSKGGLSPLSALPALLTAARSGEITAYGFEAPDGTEALMIACREETDGEVIEQKLWFDLASGAPLRGEILVDGYTVISCVITDFLFET